MSDQVLNITGPHGGQPVLLRGEPLESARAAMILIHGRGADAESILMLGEEVARPGLALLAPQAAGNTWYPYSFMAPVEQNQPWLSSALEAVGASLVIVQQAGIRAERTILLGFSQGACLMLEFAARNARQYGGVAGLSGGVIGPDGTPRDYKGSMDGTPVFLGCSNIDPHIPEERVTLTAEAFRQLGASVTARIYPNMGHTVNRDELAFVHSMVDSLMKE